jgi:hypothetical protein
MSDNDCDYVGQEFGASYPDSCCIDGYLWDADSGYAERDGWIFTKGGEIPCPACNEAEAVERLAELLADSCQDEAKQPADFTEDATERVRAHVARMRQKWDVPSPIDAAKERP